MNHAAAGFERGSDFILDGPQKQGSAGWTGREVAAGGFGFAAAFGEFVGAGLTVADAWPRAAVESADESIDDVVRRHLSIGPRRTTEREISSGTQQLVDIALKALSPGINDPHTAVQATNMLTTVFEALSQRPQRWLTGAADGEVLVTVPRPLLWDLVDHAVSSIRRVGGGYPTVVESLVVLLRTVATARPDDGDRARPMLDDIADEVERAGLVDTDLRRCRRLLDDARAELSGSHGS